MCHAVGQRMTGVRPGSFSNEHRMKCHTHAIGDRDGDEQPRGVHAPALGSGACSSPVVFLLPREMPILWASSAEKRSNFLFFTGTPRRKTLEMQTAVALSQNWRVEKGHRPAPTRRQNEPEDSSVMAVVKQQPRNRNQRFAKTKPTDDPLVITVCYPRFVVDRTPLPPRRRLWGAGARKTA